MQHGFMKNKLGQSLFMFFFDDITDFLDKKKVDVVYLDFFFNIIPHKKFLVMLKFIRG